MSIIETRLSTSVERGFTVVPARFTDIATLRSGVEYRNARWSRARRRFSASYGAFNASQRNELLNAWHACEGCVYGFLFRDWSDFSVTAQSLGNAPSGSTAVQLVKTYTFGVRTHTRTITRPVSATLTVYQDNGSGTFVAKAGTVDATTGLFTPTTAWTEGRALQATYEFDVPVRFATDEPTWALPDRGIHEVSLDLIEVVGE